MRTAWKLLKQTYHEWTDDDAPRLGAALAFYSMLSLGPLLLLLLSTTGLFFGPEAARGQIMGQIDGMIGREGASVVQEVLASSAEKKDGIIATLIGAVTLLLGASGVFGQLQTSMNRIWNVKPPEGQGIWGMLKARFLSFTMVLGTGFLLLISLAASAALAAIGEFGTELLPASELIWQGTNQLLSFGLTTVLFALIFKYVPDAIIAWRSVWIGAAITAALFTLGKLAIGLYLGQSAFSSTYGAAGSLVVLLVWVYYSAQILFFGAEFTQVYASHCDHPIGEVDADHGKFTSRAAKSEDEKHADTVSPTSAASGPGALRAADPGPRTGRLRREWRRYLQHRGRYAGA